MRTRLATLLLVGAAACQGEPFKDPPVHLNLNMDVQKRFEMQEENPIFEDRRGMRPQVEGTVAIGNLRIDDHLYKGEDAEGEPAATLPTKNSMGEPMVLNRAMLERGQERFNIYCSVCHSKSGAGNGLAVQRGMLPPPSLYDERLLTMPVGYFYQVITYGVRNMQPYNAQIPVDDRWAIAAYVRVLQRRANATLDQVPKDVASQKGWSSP